MYDPSCFDFIPRSGFGDWNFPPQYNQNLNFSDFERWSTKKFTVHLWLTTKLELELEFVKRAFTNWSWARRCLSDPGKKICCQIVWFGVFEGVFLSFRPEKILGQMAGAKKSQTVRIHPSLIFLPLPIGWDFFSGLKEENTPSKSPN